MRGLVMCILPTSASKQETERLLEPRVDIVEERFDHHTFDNDDGRRASQIRQEQTDDIHNSALSSVSTYLINCVAPARQTHR